MKIKGGLLLLSFAIGFFVLINDAGAADKPLSCFDFNCTTDEECKAFNEKPLSEKQANWNKACKPDEVCHILFNKEEGAPDKQKETRKCYVLNPATKYPCIPTMINKKNVTDCVCTTNHCNENLETAQKSIADETERKKKNGNNGGQISGGTSSRQNFFPFSFWMATVMITTLVCAFLAQAIPSFSLGAKEM